MIDLHSLVMAAGYQSTSSHDSSSDEPWQCHLTKPGAASYAGAGQTQAEALSNALALMHRANVKDAPEKLSKRWWESKTVWGSLITSGISVLAIFNIEVAGIDPNVSAEAIAIVCGTLFTVWSRYSAKAEIH